MKISTLLICIFSVFAIILNIEGSNCIVQINSLPLSNNSSNNNGEESNDSEFSNQQAERQLPRQQQQQLQQLQEDSQSQETSMQQQQQQQQSYELRKYCFLVTNLYVYCLFGVIIGFIILVLWYVRYKKIWSGKQKDSIN